MVLKLKYCNYKMGGRFLFRNTNMSTLSGLRLQAVALFFVTIFPEMENILSEGTDVAGMHSSFLASLDRVGNLSAFFFHHSRALESGPRAGYFWKCSTSSLLVSIDSFSERMPRRNCIALSFLEPLHLLVGGPAASVQSVSVESVPSLSPSISRDSIWPMSFLTCNLSLLCAEESQVSISRINNSTKNR